MNVFTIFRINLACCYDYLRETALISPDFILTHLVLLFSYQGIAPILPILREGILNGSPEIKEHAANGLGEVISLTSAPALRPFVVNITGPLIRILGDRFTWNVKVAVLQTLGLLLGKVCTMTNLGNQFIYITCTLQICQF